MYLSIHTFFKQLEIITHQSLKSCASYLSSESTLCRDYKRILDDTVYCGHHVTRIKNCVDKMHSFRKVNGAALLHSGNHYKRVMRLYFISYIIIRFCDIYKLLISIPSKLMVTNDMYILKLRSPNTIQCRLPQ
jgi:hypothetical protein